MALIWMDGFDHYNGLAANIERVYSFSTTKAVLSSVAPRTGTYALKGNSAIDHTVTLGVGGSRTVLGVGVAVRFGELPASSEEVLSLRTASNQHVATVYLMASGALRVNRSNSATLNQIGSDSTFSVPINTYVHIEIRAEIAGGNITVELRINENTEVTGSIADAGYTEISTIVLGFSETGTYFDDLFVWDTSGSTNNTFLGAKRVITLAPSANTAQADWTGSYTDITTDDGDTTTITAGTSTPVVSEFELDNLPSGVAGISAVQTVFIARTDTEGAAEVQASVISGASTADGTSYLIDTSYGGYYDIHEVDPNTTSAWTVSAVNAAKLKLSRTA